MAALSWSSRRRCASNDQAPHRLLAISGSRGSGTGPVGAMSGCPGTGSRSARGSAGSHDAGNVASAAGSSAAASGAGTESRRIAGEKKPAITGRFFHVLAVCPAGIRSALSADRCCADAWPGGPHRSHCAGRHGRCRNGARCAEHHGRCRNAGRRHHAGRRTGCPDADRRDAERHSRGSHHGSHRQEHHGPGHHGTADDHLHASGHGSGSFPAPDGSAPDLR